MTTIDVIFPLYECSRRSDISTTSVHNVRTELSPKPNSIYWKNIPSLFMEMLSHHI